MSRAELKRAVKDLVLYAQDARTLARRKPKDEILRALARRLAGARWALDLAQTELDAMRDRREGHE